jgi:tetratricopeptide (TPR) repeat protein
MKQAKITWPSGYTVIITALSVVTVSFLFVCINLYAALIYRGTIFKYIPSLKIEKFRYYENILSSVSRAGNLSPGNAEYYSAKANVLRDAIKEGLQSPLRIYVGDIEKYYLKAIELNPADFSYHSDLGLLYIQQDSADSENTLFTAIELCPNCYLIYAELANYYLSKKQEDKAFFSILDMLWRSGGDGIRLTRVMRDEYAGRLNHIAFDAKRNELVRFSIYPKAASVDFGKVGLPSVEIPLRLQIYTKDVLDEAVLYYKFSPHAFFVKKEETKSGYIVYEAQIEQFPPGARLNEFRVEVGNTNIIEELVFIIDFSVYLYTQKK